MTYRPHLLLRARWAFGGCVMVLAWFCFALSMMLWRIAEWLQHDPRSHREDT